MKNLNNIINQALTDGGATLYRYKTVSYSNGYQVAKQDTRKVSIKSDYLYEVATNEIIKRNGNCGLYVDSYGYLCIETSEHILDIEQAFKLGIDRRQESILEWSTMKYIDPRTKEQIHF